MSKFCKFVFAYQMMNSIVSAAAEVDASFIAGCKLGVSLLHGDLKCQVLMHKCFKYCTF